MSNKTDIVTFQGLTYISFPNYNPILYDILIESGGEVINPIKIEGKTAIFEHTFNPLTDAPCHPVNRVDKTEYISMSNKVISPITPDKYNSLPQSLKSLYKVSESTSSINQTIDYDFTDADSSENNEYYFSIDRDALIKRIESFNFKNNNRARVKTKLVERRMMGKYVYNIVVSFFSKPYHGEKRKILSRKSNGYPYADKRGYFVDDLPPVVNTAIINYEDIPYFTASSQEELDKKIQDYHDFITFTHLIEKD